jgi:hypothetical protein
VLKNRATKRKEVKESWIKLGTEERYVTSMAAKGNACKCGVL